MISKKMNWIVFAIGIASFCAAANQANNGGTDAVVKAMTFDNGSYPISRKLPFDQIAKDKASLQRSKYKVLAEELGRISSFTARDYAEVERLWKEYMAQTDGSPSRAPMRKLLRAEDTSPQMASYWMYMLLKPSWHAVINGRRATCIEALRHSDLSRLLRVMPEYMAVVAEPEVNYSSLPDIAYTVYGLAYDYPDARGLAIMKQLLEKTDKNDLMKQVNFSTVEWLTNGLRERDTEKAQQWRILLRDEVGRTATPSKLRQTINQILENSG